MSATASAAAEAAGTGRWPAHLADLRRDRRGIPVPFVNRWGPESVEHLDVRRDRWAGRLAVFEDDSMHPDPDFTTQHTARAREATLRGLCQVCARALAWRERWLVLSDDISVRAGAVHGQDRVVVTEPWLCEACLQVALTRCPALIRRRREEDVRVLRVTSDRQAQVSLSYGWIDGPWEGFTRTHPVVIAANIFLPPAVAARARRWAP